MFGHIILLFLYIENITKIDFYINFKKLNQKQEIVGLMIYMHAKAMELTCYTHDDRITAERQLLKCRHKQQDPHEPPTDFFLVRYSPDPRNVLIIMVYHEHTQKFVNYMFHYRIGRFGKPVVYFNKELFYTSEHEIEFENIKDIMNALDHYGYKACIIK